MNEIIEFEIKDILPDESSVLLSQGMTSDIKVEANIRAILGDALSQFQDMAHPRGIIRSLTAEEFAVIYSGEGNNDTRTPVADIYPRAENLALFAITLGEKISAKICELFDLNDFAIASMLDSSASEGADLAAEILEKRFRDDLKKSDKLKNDTAVLRYSPGYCGWHISGQRKLFDYLKPERIGIKLRDSFLMDPLKSISGVIIAAPKSVHRFENEYPCCEKCDTMSCQDRMRGF